jgi:hypothetical protein
MPSIDVSNKLLRVAFAIAAFEYLSSAEPGAERQIDKNFMKKPN